MTLQTCIKVLKEIQFERCQPGTGGEARDREFEALRYAISVLERVERIEHPINLFIKNLTTQDNKYFDLSAQELLSSFLITYLTEDTNAK